MKFRFFLPLLPLLLSAFSANAQLTGEWTDDNGSCYKIRQIENQIFWSMDNRPRVINVFTGYIAGNTITGTWVGLPGGNLQGSGTLSLRIESPNRMVKTDQTGNYGGSTWSRGACQDKPVSQLPDLSGTWYDYSANTGYSGRLSYVKQEGKKLIFTNTFNMTSEGYFIDNNNIIATGWEGGLKAALQENSTKIVWTNGSVWQRTKR
jgi:hypothetical protein